MFNYMQPQTIVSEPKTKFMKTKSNTYTVKQTKFKKMKKKSQISQPGGRAKSNRWSEHSITAEINTDDEDDISCDYFETVKQQKTPTEDAWLTKLFRISCDKSVKLW